MPDKPPIGPPPDTPEYMYDAWVSCMHWALGEPEIVEAFRRDTGMMWTPGKTGIDQLIDRSTGADYHFISAFVAWANEHIWGPIDQ